MSHGKWVAEPLPGNLSPLGSQGHRVSPAIRQTLGLGFLEEAVILYSARELTYESDRMDAFRGFLNQKKIVSYWGIPVGEYHRAMHKNRDYRHFENYSLFEGGRLRPIQHFADWLSWRNGSMPIPSPPHSQLPSWSWISGHKINYELSFWVGRLTTVTDVEFERVDGRLIRLQEMEFGTNILPEESRTIRITAPMYHGTMSVSGGRSSSPEVHHTFKPEPPWSKGRRSWLSWHPDTAPTIVQHDENEHIDIKTMIIAVWNGTIRAGKAPVEDTINICGICLTETAEAHKRVGYLELGFCRENPRETDIKTTMKQEMRSHLTTIRIE